MTSIEIRLAATLSLLNGLGFGISCIVGMASLHAGKGIATVMGFSTYGHGPFERLGIASTVPLLTGFLVVCVAEVIAGVLLWSGARGGAVLALALLPAGAVYWWGFALPFGPVIAGLRTLLIVLSWRALG
jgi:hypothetical protein